MMMNLLMASPDHLSVGRMGSKKTTTRGGMRTLKKAEKQAHADQAFRPPSVALGCCRRKE